MADLWFPDPSEGLGSAFNLQLPLEMYSKISTMCYIVEYAQAPRSSKMYLSGKTLQRPKVQPLLSYSSIQELRFLCFGKVDLQFLASGWWSFWPVFWPQAAYPPLLQASVSLSVNKLIDQMNSEVSWLWTSFFQIMLTRSEGRAMSCRKTLVYNHSAEWAGWLFSQRQSLILPA